MSLTQRPVPEDEIGFVILDKNFKNDVYLGQNDVNVAKIRAAKIFPDKMAADNHLFQLKQVQEYYKNLYDKKLYEIKPVRVSVITIPDA